MLSVQQTLFEKSSDGRCPIAQAYYETFLLYASISEWNVSTVDSAGLYWAHVENCDECNVIMPDDDIYEKRIGDEVPVGREE